jgi:hypothetical protein
MKNSISLLFYLKRSKITAERTVPVYLRITIGGQRIEISSKRYVNPDKWNTSAQKLSGSSEEVKSLNAH